MIHAIQLWAESQRVGSPARKYTLGYLAARCGDDAVTGQVSLRRLAEAAEMSYPTAKRHVRALVDLGLVTPIGERGELRRYKLQMPDAYEVRGGWAQNDPTPPGDRDQNDPTLQNLPSAGEEQGGDYRGGTEVGEESYLPGLSPQPNTPPPPPPKVPRPPRSIGFSRDRAAEMHSVLVAVIAAPRGRQMRLTAARLDLYRQHWTEQLRHEPDPIAHWRRTCVAVTVSPHHASTWQYLLPESWMRSPERRERWHELGRDVSDAQSRQVTRRERLRRKYGGGE